MSIHTRHCRFTALILACVVAMGLDSTPASAEEKLPFVRVSPRDFRYFETTDGATYIPNGLNMIAPPGNKWSEMERWLDRLAENRGNFIRIWLGNQYFDVEHQRSGEYDAERAKRIDQLLAAARKRGIRLKLCIESFRHLGEGTQQWAAKPLHHVSRGGPAENTADFFDKEPGRQQFKQKLAWYQKRFGDEPIIFGWELWNEMDAIRAGDWAAWTEIMLPELQRLFPQNLNMQSLGSYDHENKRPRYRRLCEMAGNDVAQVHRYLDLGAAWKVCHEPVDLLAADAVRELKAFGVRKPILLAESGAVEPNHSGPFKLYAKDQAGIILHDVLFAPMFVGAAGPGHIWHWDHYVDRNNLWHHFGRFARAIEGFDPIAEAAEPVEIQNPELRVLALKGKRTLLAWCRDPQNTWKTELAEGKPPRTVREAVLDLAAAGPLGKDAAVSVYDPWTDRWTALKQDGGKVRLPEFSRSLVVKAVAQ